MILRQLFDARTSTLTYLVGDPASRRAVLIDCVFEQHLRDLALIRELGLTLEYTIESHVHADHVTGAWLMADALGSQIAASRASGIEGLAVALDHGSTLDIGQTTIEVRATPGHTDGCISLVVHEHAVVFTGDALLIRSAGRTDFQQGDPHRLFRSVREQLFALPEHYAVYPGHDYEGRTVTSIAEERAHNPRLGDKVREQDFVGYMQCLGLPHPKYMAAAVPANLQGGRPGPGAGLKRPTWGPVIRTYAGVWQIEPEWVHRHGQDVAILDVRERAEVEASPIGQIAGSKLLPLSELRSRLDDCVRDRPIVCACPSGARSANAAAVLEKAGFQQVANLRGGLQEWRDLGLPLEGAAQG